MDEFTVELIVTGNELIYGRLVDTNSPWLSNRIWEEGGQVSRITLVGDDLTAIQDTFLSALERSPRMIVVTGGLGPTFDDITVEAVAKAMGRQVVLNEAAFESLRKKYDFLSRQRGVPMEITPQRRKMACVVEGATPIPNPVGLAVGTRIEGDPTIVILPGVPKEMMAMFDESVAPAIRAKSGAVTRAQELRIWMKAYGGLSPTVEDVMRRHPGAFIKTYAGDIDEEAGMRVDILVRGASEEVCSASVASILQELQQRLEGAGGRLRLQR